MRGTFVELTPFAKHRARYIDDDQFAALQRFLLADPEAGDVIPDTGGLRKVRFTDKRRGKGKRGGIRVIYYWWRSGSEFWPATLYDKDEVTDLTASQRKALKEMLMAELAARRA